MIGSPFDRCPAWRPTRSRATRVQLGGRFGDRLGARLSVRACGGVENDITRDASAAAFDPLTPFFSHRPDEGGRGYLPTLGQPAWGGGHPYLPTQNAAHPPYPTTQKGKNPKISWLLRGLGARGKHESQAPAQVRGCQLGCKLRFGSRVRGEVCPPQARKFGRN